MSRSLLMVVWNSTVGNSVSSLMWSPVCRAGASPLSTSSTLDTANTLLGTTRAVTVLGMSLAYSPIKSMST